MKNSTLEVYKYIVLIRHELYRENRKVGSTVGSTSDDRNWLSIFDPAEGALLKTNFLASDMIIMTHNPNLLSRAT